MVIKDTTFKNHIFDIEDYRNEYSGCSFEDCRFPEKAIRRTIWEDCAFNTCDFSNARMEDVALRNATFTGCKLLGVDFAGCNAFTSFNFDNCAMGYANFRGMKISKTVFRNCDLTEADFTQTNLNGAKFVGCNLSRAIFSGTDLGNADLSTALNFTINPQLNRLKGATFSHNNLDGLTAHLGIKLID